MIDWSISKSKLFTKCQRKWYYQTIVASPTSNDPLRKQAYQLKQLQSISAWRGSIVDRVIQHFIVPQIKRHTAPSEESVLEYAKGLMDKQIAFGKDKKHLCGDVSKSSSEDYCAFFDLEYGTCLEQDKIAVAEQEVCTALKNLLSSSFLKAIVEENLYVIAQREVGYPLVEGVQISCTPDMVVFYKDKAPLIADWKVHVFGTTEAWLQLGIYAVALYKAKPHKDFPSNGFKIQSPTEVRMVEFQLLKNSPREYSISNEDVADIEDYAFASASQMKKLGNCSKYPDIDPTAFQTTRSPQDCEKCQFKKLCWNEAPVRKAPIQLGLGGYLI